MNYNLITPLVHKRIEFSHENEFRLFIQIEDSVHADSYWENQKEQMGIYVPIDLNALIEKVIMPPTADLHVISKIEKILNSFGTDFQLEQSRLSKRPRF